MKLSPAVVHVAIAALNGQMLVLSMQFIRDNLLLPLVMVYGLPTFSHTSCYEIWLAQLLTYAHLTIETMCVRYESITLIHTFLRDPPQDSSLWSKMTPLSDLFPSLQSQCHMFILLCTEIVTSKSIVF